MARRSPEGDRRSSTAQGLDELEREADSFAAVLDISQICVAVTIGWFELRNPVGDVRIGRPKLFRWYDRFRERPSMRLTAPTG